MPVDLVEKRSDGLVDRLWILEVRGVAGVAERTIRDGGDAAVVYFADEVVHENRLSELEDAGATVRVVDDERTFTTTVSAGGDPTEAKVENFG